VERPYSFFSDDLLQHVAVQGKIGHQSLELRVLLAQPELAEFAQSQTSIFLLPNPLTRISIFPVNYQFDKM